MATVSLPIENLIRLLAQIAEGDDSAFGDLHRLSRPRLAAQAHSIVRCAAATEDVLQESFFAIWHQANRFDQTRAAPMTWMSTIVRNKAIDYLRAERLRSHCSLDDGGYQVMEGHDPTDGPDRIFERFQSAELVRRGISMLTSLQRQAVELAFFHDLSHPEVAHEMMIPLGTAKTWIRRGCIKLRAMCSDNLLPTRFHTQPGSVRMSLGAPLPPPRNVGDSL